MVERSWDDYQGGWLSKVVAVLPGLLQTAQELEDRAARSNSSDWTAGQSPPGRTTSPRRRSRRRASRNAMELGETTGTWLASRIEEDDPEALSLLGMIHLRAAIAAACHQDRPTATNLLGRAETLANRLGSDANHWQTSFGPTNVLLHKLLAELDLGNVSYVVENGQVDVDHMQPARGVSHRIDYARALTLAGRRDDAFTELRTAERTSQQLVRNNPRVRETLRDLIKQSPVSGGTRSSEAFIMAQRCKSVRANTRGVLGVVGTGAGGVESLRTGLVEPAVERGWRVAVTVTPTAGEWLRSIGEIEELEKLTRLPVPATPRLPGEARPHPPVDCFVVAPASANTVAKLAAGIADNQALTQVGEAIGRHHGSAGRRLPARQCCPRPPSRVAAAHRHASRSGCTARVRAGRLAAVRAARGSCRARAALGCRSRRRRLGVIPERKPGERFIESREHGMHALRHFYASVLLDAGENVNALSEYLGHTGPGFTLRTCTHLDANSQARARKAVDSVFRVGEDTDDGPQTAQEEGRRPDLRLS